MELVLGLLHFVAFGRICDVAHKWHQSLGACETVKTCRKKRKETCRNALNIERVPYENCACCPGARSCTNSTGTWRCRTSIHCIRLHFVSPCCAPYCSIIATPSDPSENKTSLACKYYCNFKIAHQPGSFATSTLQPTTEKVCE